MSPWQRFKQDWAGKKVLIMGLGLQGGGVAVARFFAQLGCQVTVTDLKDTKQLKPSVDELKEFKVKLVLGRHDQEDFETHDVVIRNPAVPKASKFLKIARRHHIPIKMEAALFAKYTDASLIGITGTRGKSTTTHLIEQILKAAGKSVKLAGNFPGIATLPLLKTVTQDTLVILELSSWQLQGFATEKISPHIAVITNLYPDHLNRYQSMAQYLQDKKIITAFQQSSDYLILNQTNKPVKSIAKATRARVVWFSRKNLPANLKLKIPGQHNLENAAAALAVAQVLKLEQNKAVKAISSFTGLPFRLEKIATFKGSSIINDTTSTTPIATIKALEASKKPLILILGGESKSLPVAQLAKKINRRASQVILLAGSGTAEIKPLLDRRLIIGEYTNQAKAIQRALAVASPSSTVLFSPGFTSFGMFSNEFERGKAFNRTIKKTIRS